MSLDANPVPIGDDSTMASSSARVAEPQLCSVVPENKEEETEGLDIAEHGMKAYE